MLVFDYISRLPIRKLYRKGEDKNNDIMKNLANFVKKFHNTDYTKLKSVGVEKRKKYFDKKSVLLKYI